MARTPEGKVKDLCVALLKESGAYYFFPVTSGYGHSGAPDIFACYLGRFIGIECKAGANKPTALQEAEMRKIEAAGGYTLVIREDTVFLLLDVLEKVRGARGIDSWVALDTHATLVSVRPKRTLK